MSWTAVAFCTPEFEMYAEPWEQMITGLGGTPVVIRMDSTGDWTRNTGLKPSAVLQAWDQIKTDWFLYTDIDTKVLSQPIIRKTNWDVGVFDNPNPHHRNKLTAAAILFKVGGPAHALVTAWAQRCSKTMGKDHSHFTWSVQGANTLKPPVTVLNTTNWMDWEANGLSVEKLAYPSTNPYTLNSMNECNRPFLIDVSRLVGRLMKGRLPTGVDRVALAYVQKYGFHSQAFLCYGRFYVVLPLKQSKTLFRLLLHPPFNFKRRAWQLLAFGSAAKVISRELSGAVFFNVGHSGLERRSYSALLRRMQVRPVFMVHDLIPITHPEFCRPGEQQKHQSRMRTVLELARGVITNSQATLDALTNFAETLGMAPPPATPAFLASPDFSSVSEKRPTDRTYFVMLGTIEPRKNHLLLLQIWKRLVEQMGDQSPLLVVIGQIGWECENVVDQLERCESLRGHIQVLSTCSDDHLANWLRHAAALLFPSFVEGFGLPLVEALACGTPVIASNLPVFREIAGDIPDYLDPLDGMGWMDAIIEYSDPGSQMRNRQLQRISCFVPPTWENHFRQVDELLEQVVR